MKKILILMLCLLFCMMSCISASADIKMPASLTMIGEEAFAGDDSITGLVKVSGNVRHIQAGAFSNTGLTALIIPRSVQHIDDYIVSGTPVIYVSVRNGDVNLSEHALDGVPVILSEPGDHACVWAEAHGVEWYSAEASRLVQYGGFYYQLRDDGTAKLLFPVDNEAVGSSVKLPYQVGYCTVTELSEYAFAHCSGLKSVSMPDTVTVLPDEVVGWPSLQFSTYSTNPDPVVPSQPEYITMDMPNPNISLPIGMENYIASPEDAPDGVWTWHTSDESIITVSQDGRFICKSYGTAAISLVIYAEDGIYCGVKYITVVEPEITIEPINPEMFNMVVGQTTVPRYFFTSNTHLAEYDFQANATVVSGNTDIITVDENDVVTAVAPGTTDLIISTFYGDATAEVRVPVTVRASELALSRTTLYTYVGVQEQLALIGELPAGATYKWSLDATELASVDQTGLVTVKDEGTFLVFCDITYADQSTQRLYCVFRSMEFVLDAAPAYDPYELLVGESFTSDDLPIEGGLNRWWFDDEEEITETYVSSDNEILLIEGDHFTALKPGKVVVTATFETNGRTTTTKLNFEIRDPYLEVFLEPGLEGEPLVVNPWDNTCYWLDYWWDSEIFISEYNFTSSNPEVVTVSADGAIYPHSNGEAQITLTIFPELGSSISTSIDVIVEGSSDTLTPSSLTLHLGESFTLTSEPELPEGVYVVDDHYFTDNDEIAIMHNSTVIATGYGATTIWHEVNLSDDTRIFSSAIVNVIGHEDPYISLNAESLTLERYHTFQLEATFAKEPDSITWFSDDEDFVRVDENGLVMLLNCYNTNYYPNVGVIATFGDETRIASCPVIALPQRFVIQDFEHNVLLAENETYRWHFSISTDESFITEPIFYVWESSDETVCTVDQDGVVTGVSTGIAYISLTALDSEDNVMDYVEGRVLVNCYGDTPTAVTLPHDAYLLTTEQSFIDYYEAGAEIEATHDWDYGYLRYESSNEDVFTVTDWGQICPVAPGTATLTVRLAGFPELTDTATVTVVDSLYLSIDKEEPVQAGETFTVTLNGIPENFPYEEIWWGYDGHAFQMLEDNGTSAKMLCVRAEGDNRIFAEFAIFNDHYTEGYEISIDYEWPEFRLNESGVTLNPGDNFDFWPEFDFDYNGEDCIWSTSNDEVLVVESENERGFVTAVGVGEADVIMTLPIDEENNITASAHIIVTDGGWTLEQINYPEYIFLGTCHSLDVWFESASWIHPEFTWTSSDPSVIQIHQNDGEDHYLEALKTGSAEITVVGEKHGEVQTISKTIHVIDTPLRMTMDVVELRPNKTKQLELVVGMGKEIESVAWRSTNAAIVSVDEEGNVTALAGDGLVEIYATAAFTDGTSAVAQCYVDIIRDDEVWVELYHYDDHEIELSINDVIHPKTETICYYIATNGTPEDINIEWHGYNEDLIKVNDTKVYYEDPIEGHICVEVEIEALKEGETSFEGRFYNDAFEWESNRGNWIRIYDPWVELRTDEQEITMPVGSGYNLNRWTDSSEGVGHLNHDVFTSSDPSVVRVAPNGDLYGVSTGTATVTWDVYADDDYHWGSLDFTVHVVGAKLNHTELTLSVGETAHLTPSAVVNESFNHHNGWWEVINPEVASVTSDGTVLAIAPGTTKIAYVMESDMGHTRAYCTVNVPYTDEAFRLSETAIEILPEGSFQLSCECAAGEPDRVEWRIVEAEHTDSVTVDENGLVVAPFNDRWNETYTVAATAYVGDEAYTAYCEVTIKEPAVRIENFDGWMGIEIDQEEFIPVVYNHNGDVEIEIEFGSDDPNVAVLDTWDDGHVFVRGVGQGVTDVHFIIRTDDGEVYVKSMTIFVNTPTPEIEKLYFHEPAILMNAPEFGPKTSAHIPAVTEPDPSAHEIIFTSSDESVFRVIQDEWRVEAAGVGTAELIATVKNHPELNTTLPVVVTDEMIIASDREDNGSVFNIMDQVRLSVESGVDLPEGAYDVYFRSHWDGNSFSLTEDGQLIAFEPGDYNLYAEVHMHGEGHENFEIWYNFTVNRDEQYFYTRDTDVELHIGEEFGASINENIGLTHVTYASDNEDVVVCFDNEHGQYVKAVAPGTATITITGWYEDGSSIECMNTFNVKVIEPETPVIHIDAPKVIRVGETLDVFISWENETGNCPDHHYVSGDENILRSNGLLEGWGNLSITGVAPGMTTLTCYASYGGETAEATVTVCVIDEAPATVNTHEMELRPGYGKQLLVTPAEGKTIESIQWISSNTAAATVDENGFVTGQDPERGRAMITAYITFTDGSTFTTTTSVYVTHDRDAWLHYRHHDQDIEMALEGPAYPSEVELYAYIGTCLAPEEIQVDWEIDNPDAFEVTGWTAYREDETGDTIVVKLTLKALAEGDGHINLMIHNDALNVSDSRDIYVQVHDPFAEIHADETEFTMNTGESRGIGYWTDSHATGALNRHLWSSSDESVVTVDSNGDVYAVGIGNATVTLSIYHNDYLWATREFAVHVVGTSLDKDEVTLVIGETVQLTPTVTDFAYIGGYGWSSSNESVACVANDGTVLAVGPGTATITYFLNDGECCAACKVYVPYTNEAFRLTQTALELPAGQNYRLGYEGAPDRVEWTSSNPDWVTVDETGLVSVNPDLNHWNEIVIVTCSAFFGEDVCTATCEVTPVPAKVSVYAEHEWVHIDVEQEEHLYFAYQAPENIVSGIELYSDDPGVAEIGYWSNGSPFVRGVSSGVTSVHYVVNTHEGFSYRRTVDIYVQDGLPEIEQVVFRVNTPILNAPGTGPITSRDVPLSTIPERCRHNGFVFSSNDENVVRVDQDGHMEAVGPGTTTINVIVNEHPEQNTTLPVVVLDSVNVIGPENNVMSVGEFAQLSIESSVPLPEDDSWHVIYSTECGDNQFRLFEDGRIYAYEPGDYWVDARIDVCEDMFFDIHYEFSVVRDENFFYTRSHDVVLHPNEKFGADIVENIGLEYWTYSSDNEDVVVWLAEEGCLKAVAPGTATVSMTGYLKDGTAVECSNTFDVTVQQPEAPEIGIVAPSVIIAGETQRVYIDVFNHTSNGPDHHFATSDDTILSTGDDGESFTITGVTPGVAYLTCFAKYGDEETSVTVPVYVISAPAQISANSFDVRPGQTKPLAVLANDGYTIESIEWSTNAPEIATVDENGNVTGVSNETGNDAVITAIITLDDGTTYSMTSYVYVVHDENTWIDFHGRPDETRLGLAGFGSPASTELWIFLNSNLAEDEITVTWESSDESVVRIDASEFFYHNDPWNLTAFRGYAAISAVQDGYAEITITVSDPFGNTERHIVPVHVETPSFEIRSDETELTISTSEVRGLDHQFISEGDCGHISPVVWSSSDDGIAYVSPVGWVTGIAPGTATITLTVYSDGSTVIDTQEYTVHVIGATFDQRCYVVEQGQAIKPVVSIPEDQEYAYVSWSTDDSSIASVSSDGTVVGISPGTTAIRMELKAEDDQRIALVTSNVSVVDTDDRFTLNESAVTLRRGQSAQLEYNSETEPDSVKWSVEFESLASIDENGLLTIHTARDYDTDLLVYCTAAFGDEARTAYCTVTIPAGTMHFDDLNSFMEIAIDAEENVNESVRVLDGVGITFEYSSDDDSVAVVDSREDGRLFVRGISSGVTTIHVTANADNGESVTHSMLVYVETNPPMVNEFAVNDNPMLVVVGENIHVQWHCSPSETHCNAIFSTEDTDLIEVTPDGHVFGLAAGRATIDVAIEQNPELNTSIDVIVIDGLKVNGLENDTISVATPVQLSLDVGEIWSEDELDVHYVSYIDANAVAVSDDGRLVAYEPGNYDIYIEIRQAEWTYSYQYFFTVTLPEDYFYVSDSDIVLIEGMNCGISYCEFQNPQDITFVDSNPGVIEMLDDDNFAAVAPGTTTLTLTAHYEDGTTVDCLNTITVTVLEPQLPELTIFTNQVVRVGETVEVYFNTDLDIDWVPFYCTSDDPSVLEVSDDWRITGVTPGVVTLTGHALFGDIAGEATASITIYVVE